MFEKIWDAHVVAEGPGGQTLLFIDRHLLHEGATHAFDRLQAAGRAMRRPDLAVATADHYLPTTPPAGALPTPKFARCSRRSRGSPRSRDSSSPTVSAGV